MRNHNLKQRNNSGYWYTSHLITTLQRDTASQHAPGSILTTPQLALLLVLIRSSKSTQSEYRTILRKKSRSIEEKTIRPLDLKLNSGGRNRPLGKRALGSRNSSKKGWIRASSCKVCKEYSSSRIFSSTTKKEASLVEQVNTLNDYFRDNPISNFTRLNKGIEAA